MVPKTPGGRVPKHLARSERSGGGAKRSDRDVEKPGGRMPDILIAVAYPVASCEDSKLSGETV